MGKLYIVATPIGNLGDITLRAITVLKEVDLIAAEDTRQTKKLLDHYGISTPLYSVHAHNEQTRSAKLLSFLQQGQNIAYVTDARTPLISDPGAFLVNLMKAEKIAVVPIPGPCAAIAALSVAGFPEPQFYFEGFLPHKTTSRKLRLSELKALTCPLIFYESPHRILKMLEDAFEVLGSRRVMIAREMTKRYETFLATSLENASPLLKEDKVQQLGEFVVVVEGNTVKNEIEIAQEKIDRVLTVLLTELSVKQAAKVAAQLLEMSKNDLYQRALSLKQQN